jgi:hypothetical protein
MKLTFSMLFALGALLIISSCKKTDDNDPSGNWSNSVFIVNEGPFKNGTGTIMAYNRDTREISGELFEAANGRPLGNIVQSASVHEGKVYIVVNNANKVEVVDLKDFKSVATIEGLTLPRYFLGIDENIGLVSCWDSTVKVINLVDYTVSSSIQVGTGPDEMVEDNGLIFVINSGGFGNDSTISVFHYLGAPMETKITVGHHPSGIKKDKNGKIWVLCSGKGWNGFPAADDTPAKLVCIDPEDLEIIKEFTFPDNENHPDNLVIDQSGATLYYNHPQGIFAFPVSSVSLNVQPFIASEKMYYSLGFDYKESMIYATDPLDNVQRGYVFRFKATDGSPVDSFMAGIVPSGFWFND